MRRCVSSLEPGGDRHRLGQHPPCIRDQGRRFMPGIDAGIERVAHLAEHIDPAERIGFAKPFEGGDKFRIELPAGKP